MHYYAKILMTAGVLLLIAGLILWISGDKFHWLGRLPGDIRIKKDNFRFYMPLTSMLLVSALLSFLAWVFKKIR
jgi:hypothetical protein